MRIIKCVNCKSVLAEVYKLDCIANDNEESVFWNSNAITPKYRENKGIVALTCNKCHTDQAVFKRNGGTYVRSYPHLIVRRNKT